MMATSRVCADGRAEEMSLQLCSSCAEAIDPQSREQRRLRKRRGYEQIFDEMRATLAERRRSGDEQALTITMDRAAEWLAGLAKNNPEIDIPEDLRPLLARSVGYTQ